MEAIYLVETIRAIDTMNRPYYCSEEVARKLFNMHEMKIMAKTTFAGVMLKLNLNPGEEWKVLAGLGKGSVNAMIEEMNELEIETVLMDQTAMWSWKESRYIEPITIEGLAQLVSNSEGRVIGGVGYNPFSIRESIERVERAVKELGFGYVWFHPISFGIRFDDRRNYPLYEKCQELNVPVCVQSGHSAEPLPSEFGHPMYADNVAIDFPDLKLVLTHTGWPWIDEWISMLWRHPNVFGNIGAWYPKDLDPRIVKFMDGRGRKKVMWATNGFGLKRCLTEFKEIEIREESKKNILRENAVRVFDL